MAEREVSPLDDAKLLGQAIANTESEIFQEVTGLAEPEEIEEGATTDRAREDMGDGLEGQVEDPDEEEGEETDEGEQDGEEDGEEGETSEKVEPTEPKTETEPQPKGRVPVGELLTERKARQAAEERATAAESQAQRDIAAMNARLDALMLQQQRPAPELQRQQPVAPTKPDMFADPEGYEAWLRADIAYNFTQQRVNASLADAHDQHGEKFVKAYQDLTGIDPLTMNRVGPPGLPVNDPVSRATVDRIMTSPNPGRALMNWHAQQQVIRDGGTPQFREKVETEAKEKLMKDPEFRKQLLAEMKAEASGLNGGTARTITRGTRSINDVTGGTSAQRDDMRSFDDSDEGVFGDVWKS
jgi:hypothetical protein